MVTSPVFLRSVSSTGTGRACATRYRFTVNIGVHQSHGHVGHAEGLALAGARENHVLHAGAAQALGGLFSEDPTDGIADVGLAAAIRSDDGGDALTVESQLSALAKGFESLQFDAFEFQQSIALCSGGVVTILNSKRKKVKYLHHTGRVFSANHHNRLGGDVAIGRLPPLRLKSTPVHRPRHCGTWETAAFGTHQRRPALRCAKMKSTIHCGISARYSCLLFIVATLISPAIHPRNNA